MDFCNFLQKNINVGYMWGLKMSECILLLSVISVVDRESSNLYITYTGESTVDFRQLVKVQWTLANRPMSY